MLVSLFFEHRLDKLEMFENIYTYTRSIYLHLIFHRLPPVANLEQRIPFHLTDHFPSMKESLLRIKWYLRGRDHCVVSLRTLFFWGELHSALVTRGVGEFTSPLCPQFHPGSLSLPSFLRLHARDILLLGTTFTKT